MDLISNFHWILIPAQKYILENHGLGQGVAKKRALESKNPQDLKDWKSVQNDIL